MIDMSKRATFAAVYTLKGPDATHWESAPAYRFVKSLDRDGMPCEGGEVRFAWNERGLFVRSNLVDSFLIATDPRDEQLHFETGDVFELFVKPLYDDYYWEMYATPNGNKSTLFFPRHRVGMTTEDFLGLHDFKGLEVTVEKMATGWSALMFVPAEQLTALGGVWEAEADWSIFCGRYNYNNAELADPELSMIPQLTKTNFHLTDEYAVLILHKAVDE